MRIRILFTYIRLIISTESLSKITAHIHHVSKEK